MFGRSLRGAAMDNGDEECSPARKEKGYSVAVDLKSLFLGQQFSFLREEEEDRQGVGQQAERASSPHSSEEVGHQEESRTPFFFHWDAPNLSNRGETSFTSKRSREEQERAWPEQRTAMKSMLRKSHRQATQRHKGRLQTTVKN